MGHEHDRDAAAGRRNAGPTPVRYLAGRLLVDGKLLSRLMLLGALLGVVTTGVLAQLAMRLLAAVNGVVRGIRTDDGFVVGAITLQGSLQLALVGAVFGALSGLLYAALAPLQIGPSWFGTLSISVGAGVVTASQVVHSDGVDFSVLQPLWLAVAMFVLIPVVHVAVLDRLGRMVRSGGLMRSPGWAVAGVVPMAGIAPAVAVVALARVIALLAARDAAVAWGWARTARLVLAVLFVLAVVDLIRDIGAVS